MNELSVEAAWAMDDEGRRAGAYDLRCDGCGKRITVEPWRFGPFITHPNRRCADAAESKT